MNLLGARGPKGDRRSPRHPARRVVLRGPQAEPHAPGAADGDREQAGPGPLGGHAARPATLGQKPGAANDGRPALGRGRLGRPHPGVAGRAARSAGRRAGRPRHPRHDDHDRFDGNAHTSSLDGRITMVATLAPVPTPGTARASRPAPGPGPRPRAIGKPGGRSRRRRHLRCLLPAATATGSVRSAPTR